MRDGAAVVEDRIVVGGSQQRARTKGFTVGGGGRGRQLRRLRFGDVVRDVAGVVEI